MKTIFHKIKTQAAAYKLHQATFQSMFTLLTKTCLNKYDKLSQQSDKN